MEDKVIHLPIEILGIIVGFSDTTALYLSLFVSKGLREQARAIIRQREPKRRQINLPAIAVKAIDESHPDVLSWLISEGLPINRRLLIRLIIRRYLATAIRLNDMVGAPLLRAPRLPRRIVHYDCGKQPNCSCEVSVLTAEERKHIAEYNIYAAAGISGSHQIVSWARSVLDQEDQFGVRYFCQELLATGLFCVSSNPEISALEELSDNLPLHIIQQVVRKSPQLVVVRWYYSKFTKNQPVYLSDIFKHIHRNHLEVVQWLLEFIHSRPPCPTVPSLNSLLRCLCPKRASIAMVQLILAHGAQISRGFILEMAASGSIEVFEWLLFQGYFSQAEFPLFLQVAWSGGNLPVLKFITAKAGIFPRNPVPYHMIGKGRLDILRWMYQNNLFTSTHIRLEQLREYLVRVVAYDDLKTLRWFHRRNLFPQDHSFRHELLQEAIRHNRDKILDWILSKLFSEIPGPFYISGEVREEMIKVLKKHSVGWKLISTELIRSVDRLW
jgi:hypothetical protein